MWRREALVAQITAALPSDRENAALVMWERREPEDFAVVRPELPQLQAEWDNPALDLDKAWRGILGGARRCSQTTAEVVTRAVSSGTPLGPNLGYAPAGYHEPPDVVTLAAELGPAVDEYSAIVGDYTRELGYLRDYYLAASRDGSAMLLFFV